jgi:hypothetical protein
MKVNIVLFKLFGTAALLAILFLLLGWIIGNYDLFGVAKFFGFATLFLLVAAIIALIWEENFS